MAVETHLSRRDEELKFRRHTSRMQLNVSINCEIWELFSLSCPNAYANMGAPPKLPAERRRWDP